MTELQIFRFDENGRFVTPELDGEPLIKGLESHLYVVEFGRYGLKVGITGNLRTRLATHARDGRNFGRPATRGWISPPHVEAKENERALISFCNKSARAVRSREYFTTPFERACGHAASLPMSRGDRGAHEAHVQAVANGFIQLVTRGLR